MAGGPWVLALGSLAYLAIERAPLIYDGSFFLFTILETQAPMTPDGRIVPLPAQWLTIMSSRLTDDTWLLALVFSAGYLALVGGAFVVATLLLRRVAHRMQAWPLMGLLAVSPILVDTTTESLVTSALAFPAVLLAARSKTLASVGALTLVVVLLFVSHPAAGLVLVLCGAVSLGRWLWTGRRAVLDLCLAGLLAAVGVTRLRMLDPGYEVKVGQPSYLVGRSLASIGHVEAFMLLTLWATAALLLLARFGKFPSAVGRWIPVLPLLGALPLIFQLMVGNPNQWPARIDYRLVTVTGVLPLLVAVAVDAMAPSTPEADAGQGRTGAVCLAAFSLIMALQGWHWQHDVDRVRAAVSATPAGCAHDVTGPRPAVMNHWGSRSLVVLIQGRSPRTVLGSTGECNALIDRRVYSASNDFPARYNAGHGWFRLPDS
jgi:hypothetical protein